MASKNKAIQKAAKQLRALLKNLDETKKVTPLIKSLQASLTKAQTVNFNKKLPNLKFIMNSVAPHFNKGNVSFNKGSKYVKVIVSFPNATFNKKAPAVLLNKK